MVYQGGKFKQSKEIAPIINLCIQENNIENYYEPFVGGANILDKIVCKNLYANDLDEELISFYNYIKNGGEPVPTVSKEEYLDAKNHSEKYEKYYLGNIKYMSSFGGKPWGGYGGIDKRSGKNHYQSSLTNFNKQIPQLKRTNFSTRDYSQINYKDKSFICCDPPYRNTTGYKGILFDYERFDNWFREISKNHFVILCEYSAPNDFICFKEIGIKKTLAAADNKTKAKDCLWYTNGLFKDWYESQYL